MDLFLSCVMYSCSFQVHERLSKELFTAYVIFLCLVFHTSAIKATKCFQSSSSPPPSYLFPCLAFYTQPSGHEILSELFFPAAFICFSLACTKDFRARALYSSSLSSSSSLKIDTFPGAPESSPNKGGACVVAWLWSLTPFVVKQGKEKRLTNRLQQWQSCHSMGGGGGRMTPLMYM